MMNKKNGQTISTVHESIQQAIEDIITTPIGSRVMRRTYGSLIFELIDQSINDALILKCYSAIYTAVSTWENRIDISQIKASGVDGTGLVFDIEGVYKTTGQEMNLRIPLNMGAQA